MGRNPLKMQVHAANEQRWLAQAGGDSIPGSGTAQRQQGGICSAIFSCQSARDRHEGASSAFAVSWSAHAYSDLLQGDPGIMRHVTQALVQRIIKAMPLRSIRITWGAVQAPEQTGSMMCCHPQVGFKV